MSFRDSAYPTSSINRPAVPEDISTPEENGRILDELKYRNCAIYRVGQKK